jgi:hypothetical protein
VSITLIAPLLPVADERSDSTLLRVNGREQGGVGANQQRALASELGIVGITAALDPGVGAVHRLRSELGREANDVRVDAVGVGVEVGERADQRLERLAIALMGAVGAPPLDLELGRPRRVEAGASGSSRGA